MSNILRRRDFLSRSVRSSLGGSALLNTLFHLRGINSAMAGGGPIADYKALVCVFMKGGNDTNNTQENDNASMDQSDQ